MAFILALAVSSISVNNQINNKNQPRKYDIS